MSQGPPPVLSEVLSPSPNSPQKKERKGRRQGRNLSNKTTTIIIRRKSLRAALGRADPVLAETRPHAARSPDADAFGSRFAGTGCFKGAAFG